MRRRSIITVGKDRAEIKIYTLRRPNGVASYQCAWYDLGKRQTKTFAEIENAKFFAQGKTLSLRNEGKVDLDPVGGKKLLGSVADEQIADIPRSPELHDRRAAPPGENVRVGGWFEDRCRRAHGSRRLTITVMLTSED